MRQPIFLRAFHGRIGSPSTSMRSRFNKTQAARRCKEDSLLWLLMPYHNYKMDRGKALSVRGGSSQIQKNPPHIFPLDFVIACLQQRSMYANVD